MDKNIKKVVNSKKTTEAMDGFVRLTGFKSMEHYERHLNILELKIDKLEERILDIERVLMLGRS